MSGTNSQVNIIAVVDVIGALSIKSLLDGNLCMVDDGAFNSAHQGTPNLVTVVRPGQVVSWTALAVDLQTPVEIKSISFMPGNGHSTAGAPGAAVPGTPPQGSATAGSPGGPVPNAPAPGALGPATASAGAEPHGDPKSAKLDLDVWTGVVPHWMTRGVPYQYRLEVQMYDGPNSIMHIDSPALMCQ